MTIALVSNVGAAGISSGVTTGSIDTTGANLLVVVWCDHNDAGAAVISDSKSNSWTSLTAQASVGGGRTRMAYVLNPTVGSGHTFTASGGSTYPSIAALAFSGVKTSAAFDVQNGANGIGTSLAPGSITPSENNEVLIFGLGGSRANAASVDVGTITHQNVYVGGTNYSIAGAYQIQTTATARNPSWSWSGSTSAQAVIASFKAAAGGVVPLLMHQYRQRRA